ncbi:MAG TPA: hypothetical protein VEN78_39415 [Bradyrhizobium sp.]|nr:hypothetical protein [Bradyrhizobium sp.]
MFHSVPPAVVRISTGNYPTGGEEFQPGFQPPLDHEDGDHQRRDRCQRALRSPLQGFTVCSIKDLASPKPSIIPRAFVRQRYDDVCISFFE